GLAPPVSDLRRGNGVPGGRHLPGTPDRGARATRPRGARRRAARRAGGRRLRQHGRRSAELPRPFTPPAADVSWGAGLGGTRTGPVLDGSAHHRHDPLVGHHLPGTAAPPDRREPGQSALVVPLRRVVDPDVLRGRPANSYTDPIRNRRLLAVLGRPPLGR